MSNFKLKTYFENIDKYIFIYLRTLLFLTARLVYEREFHLDYGNGHVKPEFFENVL